MSRALFIVWVIFVLGGRSIGEGLIAKWLVTKGEPAVVVYKGAEIPVFLRVDVLVVGGSISGVAAAWMVKKCGVKVILVEESGFLGGPAVVGLEKRLWGLDENIGGIGRRILNCLAKNGGLKDEFVDPEWLKITLDQIISESRIPVLLHSKPIGVVMVRRKVCGVVFLSKSGKFAILARVVIDATLGCELLRMAQESGFMRLKLPNISSLGFTLQDVPAVAEVGIPLPALVDNWAGWLWIEPTPWKGEVSCRILKIERINIGSAGDLSDSEFNIRLKVLGVGDRLKEMFKAKAGYVSLTASKLLIIPGRCPRVKKRIFLFHIREGKRFEKAIAWGTGRLFVGSYDLQRLLVRDLAAPMTVPLGAIIPEDVENLVVTYGDKLLVTPGPAWVESLSLSVRMGEAAGTLAAWAVKVGRHPSKIGVELLLDKLRLVRH